MEMTAVSGILFSQLLKRCQNSPSTLFVIFVIVAFRLLLHFKSDKNK